ncbi:zinc transporter ZIP13 isoform X6 [Dipodomys spectabilis]|uniref:zinc transporter ZIP13 isoform X6 n=1 Tax=Dipodomys spectabilis TaxID=105255 RepID=UPI001C54B076|nr:zinc transporter ZIP13 isoform X6 [Dipodomys spectabilis]
MPGCSCPGCGMVGQRLFFLTALALEFLGRAGAAQPALRSLGAAAACRLDNKESESWEALLSGERLDTWICSLLGSLMVGLSGVFPLLIIPLEMGAMLRSEAGAQRLKQLLSFALGGLLGNVFLHLLPEAWAYTCSTSPGGEGQSLQQQQQLGLWVIAGFLTFLALEKTFLNSKEKEGISQIGLVTTMAILLHEIPHEVGDFAILLRAGFDRWSAAKLQLSTALGGLLGACFAICTQSPKGPVRHPLSCAEETVAWILPFTSGGFLYIALVNVLPDLLEEDDPWRSLQQVLLLCSGIVVMVVLSFCVE